MVSGSGYSTNLVNDNIKQENRNVLEIEGNINLFTELIFRNETAIMNMIMFFELYEDEMTRGMGEHESMPGYDKCRRGMTCWVNTS